MFKYLLVFYCVLGFQKSSTELIWNKEKPLQWGNFKGIPDKEARAVAITASGISYSYSLKKRNGRVISYKTRVKAIFYTEQSWCKKKVITNYILKHEQLHFDITELHARRFKKKIANLKPSNNLAEILKMHYDETNNEWSEMQKQYDDETDYSIDNEKQKEWSLFISKELKKYANYR